MSKGRFKQKQKKLFWLIPLVILIVTGVGVGGHYALNCGAQTEGNSSPQPIETTVESELDKLRRELERDSFVAGIWIDEIDLSNMTFAQAEALLLEWEQQVFTQPVIVFADGDKEWSLCARDVGLLSDWRQVLERAWHKARPEANDSEDILRDKHLWVQSLSQEPYILKTSLTWSEKLAHKRISRIASEINIEPYETRATSFDLKSHQFVIEEGTAGFYLNVAQCLADLNEAIGQREFGTTRQLSGETIAIGETKAQLERRLGLVSEARTYAKAYDPNRDENIRLICQKLNGMLLQPGETFSFNKYIGQRTKATGFKPAGGIVNGILEPDIYGGGICQPNTTLYQALAMADMEIVERHPHSWPSSYTTVGLDATVSWGGADFKFRNNTDAPMAIVAWYDKPAVVFQVYARKLDPGVKITLSATHDGYLDVDKPIEKLNNALKPGQKVVIRTERRGQLATSYKIWQKDGVVFKRELLAKSRYRPIQGIYEIGPPLPPPAENKSEETKKESKETTKEESSAQTTTAATSETIASDEDDSKGSD